MRLLKKIILIFWTDLRNEWPFKLKILLPVLIVLFFLDYHYLNIGFLQLHSIDEYAFHGSLLNMYHGFIGLNLSLFFRFGFYSYGFLYFLINFIFSSPFLATANISWAIFIPKAITSFFAVGALCFIFDFFRLYLNKILSSLLLLTLVLMPGFWGFATWFHPDWVMTAFLVMTIYFLAKDKFVFLENYWLAVIFFGLALAIKFQAITFIPLLLLYNLQGLGLKEIIGFKNRIFLFIKTILVLCFIFIFCNPYILHPVGFQVFRSSLIDNFISNATNHGSANVVSLGSKIFVTVGETFINSLVLMLLFSIAIYLIVSNFKKFNVFTVIAGNFLINFLYLLFFVNKGWGWYYLPVIMSGILLFVPFLKEISFRRQIFFIAVIILLNLSGNYKNLIDSFKVEFDKKSFSLFQAQSDSIIDILKERVDPNNDHILISPLTGFDFGKLNFKYDQIHIINGALSAGMLDQNIYNNQVSTKFGAGSDAYRPFFKKRFVILRKDDNYFNSELMSKMLDQTAYQQANDLITKLRKGDYGCFVIADNNLVLIFQCK